MPITQSMSKISLAVIYKVSTLPLGPLWTYTETYMCLTNLCVFK